MAPASCQKTITSATAMELLGPQYRYRTILGYDGEIANGALNGNLYIIGSGRPRAWAAGGMILPKNRLYLINGYRY